MSNNNFKSDADRDFLLVRIQEQQNLTVVNDGKQNKNLQEETICRICERKLSSKKNLIRHMKQQHPSEISSKVYSCDHYNKHHLTNHLKTHDKNREKNLKCNQCDYKTDHLGSFKIHMQQHNPNRVKFPCLYCSYEATRRGSLKRHLKIQHDPNRIKHLK
ncbi:hypothetical protein PVAND_017393 [Polypedilum vanderplanki]|uniref:C2H2-type domain-containing protein n=1 Tax=Polypedilum vanderplanki TaxID=319348 RepID=A0A9J6BIG4_POLVA|nr:hypothetical protein PVAND_017393 [Polypedilum vanderplanki]